MYKANGAWISSAKLARVLSLLVCASGAFGATVAQWTGSSSGAMWATSSNFSSLYSNLTAIGGNGQPLHSVVSVNEISTQNLNQSGFLVVSDATRSLQSSETQALTDWVQSGGILMLFASPSAGGTARTVGNQILTSLSSAISGSSNMNFNGTTYGAGYYGGASGPLAGSDPAVAGITGNSLAWYQANGVSGGAALSTGFGGNYDLGNYLRVGNFSSGKVYVFGDQFGANWNVSGYQPGSNLQFFLNLLAQESRYPGSYGPEDPFNDNPEPASIALTGIGLAAVAWIARRRRQGSA